MTSYLICEDEPAILETEDMRMPDPDSISLASVTAVTTNVSNKRWARIIKSHDPESSEITLNTLLCSNRVYRSAIIIVSSKNVLNVLDQSLTSRLSRVLEDQWISKCVEQHAVIYNRTCTHFTQRLINNDMVLEIKTVCVCGGWNTFIVKVKNYTCGNLTTLKITKHMLIQKHSS